MIKIKVIDLLNKMANGEEMPQLIKFNGYVYDKLGCEYYMLNDRDITLFGNILDTNGKYLNDEVEIIEDKKIERLQWCNIKGDSTKAQLLELRENVILQFDKINEIIDYINKGE